MWLKIFPIIIFLIIIPVVSADFQCQLREGSCPVQEKCILKQYQANNSHVGTCNSTYNYSICCTEIALVKYDRGECTEGGKIVSIYQLNNSHVAQRNYFDIKVCARFQNDDVIANIRNGCNSDEVALFTLYQLNDSHIGDLHYQPTNTICIQNPPVHSGSLSMGVPYLITNDTNITMNVSPTENYTLEVGKWCNFDWECQSGKCIENVCAGKKSVASQILSYKDVLLFAGSGLTFISYLIWINLRKKKKIKTIYTEKERGKTKY